MRISPPWRVLKEFGSLLVSDGAVGVPEGPHEGRPNGF